MNIGASLGMQSKHCPLLFVKSNVALLLHFHRA